MLNLTAAEAEIKKADFDLWKLLKSVGSAGSALTDLSQGFAAFKLGVSYFDGYVSGSSAKSPETVSVVSALIAHSVVLFVRATGERSSHRNSIQFATKRGSEFHERAERVRRLRSNAIAHYGPGHEGLSRPWNSFSVLLNLQTSDIESASQQLSIEPQLVEDLNILFPAAIVEIGAIVEARSLDLKDYLVNLPSTSAAIPIMMRYPFDEQHYDDTVSTPVEPQPLSSILRRS